MQNSIVTYCFRALRKSERKYVLGSFVCSHRGRRYKIDSELENFKRGIRLVQHSRKALF